MKKSIIKLIENDMKRELLNSGVGSLFLFERRYVGLSMTPDGYDILVGNVNIFLNCFGTAPNAKHNSCKLELCKKEYTVGIEIMKNMSNSDDILKITSIEEAPIK